MLYHIKKDMKKVLKVALIVILIIALIVGGYFIYLNLTKKQALDTVDKMFTAIKTGDEEQIKQYINIDNLKEEEEEAKSNIDKDQEMEKIMLNNLNYEVISTDVKFNQCTVKLNISNKNLKTVFENYIAKAFSLAFSQAFGAMTEEEMDNQLKQYFEEQYNSESTETITSEMTIDLKKENGKWTVNCDEDKFVDAVLPGYKEVVESLNSINKE